MEPPSAPREPRQRWRITFRRGPDAPILPTRDEVAAWEAAVSDTGLPLVGVGGGRPRPKLVFGAPLAAGVIGERELVDILLAERLTIGEVRRAVAVGLPLGHELVDLEDVWLGAPGLPSVVVAADYRLVLSAATETGDEADPAPPHPRSLERLVAACRHLLRSAALPRRRGKAGSTTEYDLRPLLDDLRVEAGPPVALLVRLRFDPDLGVGRPDAVLEALVEVLGHTISVAATVRERLLLRGD